MKLGYDKIKEITCGAARVIEEDGGFHFRRFTDEQMEIYEKYARAEDFIRKSYATSGVRFEFKTDGKAISFSTHVKSSSSRKFFGFDLYVNGSLCGHVGETYSGEGEFDYNFELGEGDKEAILYFPWSTCAVLSDIEIEDATYVCAMEKKPKMICFGDSITHGYDAEYPSLSYASQLADKLGAEAFNKGIGGEKFFPILLDTAPECDAKYITVAYGTNDWSGMPRETFERDCKAFYEKLSALYPEAKIFAITPIWRGDMRKETKCGAFESISEYMRKITAELQNIYVIEGMPLTPHHENFYSDKYLHPNDLGFCIYADRLYNEIKKII